jgi:hypothetical protein
MALIADSGAIVALYDRRDPHHRTMTQAFQENRAPALLPVLTLPEIDFLLGRGIGAAAQAAFLNDLRAGAYTRVALVDEDLEGAAELASTYGDLGIGLVDASVIAAAERLGVTRIATLDQRHFRSIRPRGGKPFTLVPWDE